MTQALALQVRPASSADLDALVDFNMCMASETEGRLLDSERVMAGVRAVLEDSTRGSYFVAESDGRVVGSLLLTREWSDWRNGWFWWIQSVYTQPDSRRKGVYRGLYDYLLRRARSDTDVAGIRLYVEGENKAAMKAYSELGMKRTSYKVYEVDFVLS